MRFETAEDEAPLAGVQTNVEPDSEETTKAPGIDLVKCLLVSAAGFLVILLILGAHDPHADHQWGRAITYWLNDHLWGWEWVRQRRLALYR